MLAARFAATSPEPAAGRSVFRIDPPTIGGRSFQGETPMNLILALIIGGIIGGLASIVMRTNAQQGILMNIVVGIIGSLLGSFLLGGVFGANGSILNSPLDG